MVLSAEMDADTKTAMLVEEVIDCDGFVEAELLLEMEFEALEVVDVAEADRDGSRMEDGDGAVRMDGFELGLCEFDGEGEAL